jgi:hypothetical protein
LRGESLLEESFGGSGPAAILCAKEPAWFILDLGVHQELKKAGVL